MRAWRAVVSYLEPIPAVSMGTGGMPVPRRLGDAGLAG